MTRCSWAQSIQGVCIGPNIQVSDAKGPDAQQGTFDDDPKAQIEPVIAASPTTTGLLLVGACDESPGSTWPPFRSFRLGFMTSTDAGSAWIHDISTILGGGNLPEPTRCVQSWQSQQARPGVAIGGNAVMYLAGCTWENEFWFRETIFFARHPEADPAPGVWQACDHIPGTCPTDREGEAVRNPTLAADHDADPPRADRVYAIWERGSPSTSLIRFAYSHAAGQDWLGGTSAPPVTLAAGTSPIVNSVGGPALAVGPDGEVYAAWGSFLSNPDPNDPMDSTIRVRKSINGGVSFTDATRIRYFNEISSEGGLGRIESTADRAVYNLNSYPSIAVDCTPCGSRGNVYIAFAEERASGPNAVQSDVWVTRSTDGGGTWDDPGANVISGDPDGRDQYFPAIAVDAYGRVGVVWMDKRGAPGDAQFRVHFAFSCDGGLTWSQNVAVADTFSNPGGRNDPVAVWDIGDSIGLAAQHDTFYAVWTDFRNWDHFVAVQAGDTFTAAIRLPAPDLDRDLDVDLSDFTLFAQCFGGADNPPNPNCPPGVDADLDCDGDVDLADFGIFGENFTGADVPWCPCDAGGRDGMSGERPLAAEGLYWMLYAYCQEHGIPFT